MKIAVTGRRDTGLTAPVREETITATIEYDPEKDYESGALEFKIVSSDSGRVSYQGGFIGFAIEKNGDYGLIIIYHKRKNWRSIAILIDRVDCVIRDGQELPPEEWLTIRFQDEKEG